MTSPPNVTRTRACAGFVGFPVPGVDLKLVPAGPKLEACVRGPNVTPGYWRDEAATSAAFDEEGYYRTGDAMRFLDAENPAAGLEFDGRLTEDFKLTTGTWVHVGGVRVGALAAASPAVQDAVVAGENRGCIGVLAWLNAAGCQKLVGSETPVPPAELARDERVRAHVRAALSQWNAAHPGQSERIARVLLLPDMPSIDANEITDKGYINQRLALERRKAEVERLFASDPDADIIVI